MEINIIDMRNEDLEEVLEVDGKCFPAPWPKSAFLFEINGNPLSRYYVAKIGNKVIGYAGIWAIVNEGHITNICVDPDYRGNQVGDLLLEKLIESSQKMGMERMTLEVRKSNKVAISLYEKYEFYSVGVRPNYYRKEKEDAIIMWKEF